MPLSITAAAASAIRPLAFVRVGVKLGMRFRECKPVAARLVPGSAARSSTSMSRASRGAQDERGRAGGKKGPTVAGRALGVWERMPERPDPCAAGPAISQVRKAQRVLRLAQRRDFALILLYF